MTYRDKRFWPYRPALKVLNANHFIEQYLFNIYFCDSDNRVAVSKPAACPVQCEKFLDMIPPVALVIGFP